MKEIVEKLIKIEEATSTEKGRYNLFGLFLREDSNKWDILVAADWITENKEKSLKYLAGNIQKSLNPNEISLISRIVILDNNNPTLPAIQNGIMVEHSFTELRETNFFGLNIKHGFLITSQKNKAA